MKFSAKSLQSLHYVDWSVEK